ncbi:MAG: MATE family efflux transporter [Verrucomicrobiota bacterium]
MNTDDVKKAAWRGALYNYGRVVVRIGLGLVTFRLLFQGLTPEEFGFWSLMWSVFGYGILLDFGFGYAAQRRVAQGLANRDWPALSHALSTIFFFYFGAALVIAGLGWMLAEPMMHWFGVPDERRAIFKPVTVVFFAGMALGFPLGVFPEVLRGLQKSDTVNRINMCGLVANAILVALALHFRWGLMSVFVIALGCVLIPDLIAGRAAFKAMPEVRLRPSLFRMSDLLSTGKFSLFAWLNMISNLLRNKMDQVIVGGLVGLPAVALYQSGGKAGEMFGIITRQIADALSPAAAFLHADARVEALREMLVKGVRLTVLVAAPFYVGGALYLDLMVRLLTGMKAPASETLIVGEILLFWYFHLSITHLVFKNMFMMCGHERKLMWQSLGEAALNILLSVGLTLWSKSIIGVAAGSVLPTVYFGWFMLWRWASVEAAVGKWELFRLTALRPILGCVPMILTGVLFRLTIGPRFGQPEWLPCLIGMAVTGVAAVLGLWFIALTPEDRKGLVSRLPARFRPASLR